MRLARILALFGVVVIISCIVFIIGSLISYENNLKSILVAILVIMNGFISLGVSDIMTKLEKQT